MEHANLPEAARGIFLLNTALTVERGKPNSHSDLWSEFTDDCIRFIAEHNKTCVFLLLGNNAKSKVDFVPDDEVGRRVVMGTHPSPLSASKGFFGSGVFKRVEAKLGKAVNWQN